MIELQFINETVRLANIVPGIFRKSLAEIKFKGVASNTRVETGELIFPSCFIEHIVTLFPLEQDIQFPLVGRSWYLLLLCI